MDQTHLLTFLAGIDALVALVAVPLVLGWVPVNDAYGYRVGNYRDWSSEKWRRVNRALGVRLAWGSGCLAVVLGLLAWWGPVVRRDQLPWLTVAPIVLLLIVILVANRGAAQEAQTP